MRYRRAKVKGGTYFFTVVTFNRVKVFTNPKSIDLLRIAIKKVMQKHPFWEHLIRNQQDLNRHIEYIHYNPVKHGLAKAPIDWEYSSFHRYVDKRIYDGKWGAGNKVEFDDAVGYE